VLAALSGVDEVGVRGTTAKAYMATQGVIVQVSRGLTDVERTGIEQAIKALPKATSPTYEAPDVAYTRIKKVCKDQPVLLDALESDFVAPSFRFVFTPDDSTPANPPGLALSKVSGVENVLVVPKSAL
jgi:hypothetical protein